MLELTRRLAAGEEAAFREFHAQYFDALYRFLLQVTRGDAHAAQEALQQTLLRVAKHAQAFESEEVFWGWLKVIARNAARDGGRKERRYFGLLRTASEAAESTERETWREVLAEALAECPPEDRRLIEGKYLFGSTVAELAAAESTTESAIESRLVRLRRSLAEKVQRKLNAS